MDRKIIISQYIAMRSVGIYVRRGWEMSQEQALANARLLHEALEHELGTAMAEPSSNDNHMYVRALDTDTRHRANWPQMIEWLHDHLVKYHQAVAAAEASVAAD